MTYFNTTGAVTKVFPTAFNSGTNQTNTVYTFTVTGLTYNDAGGSLTKAGAYSAYSANVLAGTQALVISGSFVTADKLGDNYVILSNNANRIVIAGGALGAAADAQTDISASNQISSFKPNDSVVLRAFNVLTRPGSADTVTICDKAGTNLWAFTVPTATTDPIPFNLNGIVMPIGGFGVTTTAASSVYQWVFDVQSSTL